MKTTLPSHPSWTVELIEASCGVYSLVAVHTCGANIDLTGDDPDLLVKRALISADEVESDLERSRYSDDQRKEESQR